MTDGNNLEIHNNLPATEKTRISEGALSPVEHHFWGSTPFDFNDPQRIDVEECLDKAVNGNKEALRKLTTPIFLLKGEKPFEEVRRERNLAESNKITSMGSLQIIDYPFLVLLNEHKMSLWFEPSPLSEDGTAKPEWKIYIGDSNEEKKEQRPEWIKDLTIREGQSQWFTFEWVQGEPYGLLKLKVGQPNNPELKDKETEPISRPPRVLIVEDEGNIEGVLRGSFEFGGGVDVEEESYPCGKDAIDMLDKRGEDEPAIDVLITDLGLQDGEETGFDVAEAFRKKFSTAKIIFLTANFAKVEKKYTPEQLKALNMQIVKKPFSPAVLLGIVKTSTPSS